jgi:2-iminobutanoate/2-iminopropanoate deaminase
MILKREAISTDAAPVAAGPYSQAIRAGDLVFTAGQLGIDPASGELVGDDVQAQATRALANVAAILEAAGSGMDRLVKVTVYLADIAEW